jgi:desulfoferrodoxin-like iron-binding protein
MKLAEPFSFDQGRGDTPIENALISTFKSSTDKSQEVVKMVNVAKEGQVFECEICGNIVVVKEVGGGELVCCGQPMNLVQG